MLPTGSREPVDLIQGLLWPSGNPVPRKWGTREFDLCIAGRATLGPGIQCLC